MKKTLLLLLGVSVSVWAMAQQEKKKKTDWTKIDLTNRAADHLLVQYGGDSWTGRPDSVRTGNGFSRHFNFYFMIDKPFKTNPHFSVALGAGIGSSNIFFNNTRVDIRSNTARLPFTKVDSVDHFKKSKVTTMYLEAPVELRYYANPANPGKSWKAALGLKLGTLLKSYTKSKNLVTKSGSTIYGSAYVEKQSSKRFFNGTMMALTGRIGYGSLSVDAGYQVNSILKDGAGPSMHKFSMGITISGL